MKLSWGFFKLFNLFPALKDINWCLIFGITPSQVLNFFQNLPSLKIGAYRLVLIKQNACIYLYIINKKNFLIKLSFLMFQVLFMFLTNVTFPKMFDFINVLNISPIWKKILVACTSIIVGPFGPIIALANYFFYKVT